METKVVTSNKTHFDLISKCHIRSFPESLSSALGSNFIKVMLSWYLSSDKVFLFHIENNLNVVIGYCGGIIVDGTLGTGSTSGMAQHTFKAAIRGFISHPWLLFHKELRNKWPIFFKNILMKIGLKSKQHFSREQVKQFSAEPSAGLVVIGVAPSFQGKGYGSILLQEFERIVFSKYGIKNLQLSVNADNTLAIRAYEKNGWFQASTNGKSFVMKKYIAIGVD